MLQYLEPREKYWLLVDLDISLLRIDFIAIAMIFIFTVMMNTCKIYVLKKWFEIVSVQISKIFNNKLSK